MKRILVTDDEERLTKLYTIFLTKKAGFEVLSANSGEEALDIIAKENIDLLILDKRMPGIGGLGVLKKLKEDNNLLPVIILTGSEDITAGSDERNNFGYKNILLKPVELAELLKKINEVLGV